MMNLKPANDNTVVEIHGGKVIPNAALLTDASRVTYDESGKLKFFVQLIDNDDCGICLWDGDSLSDAVTSAKEIAHDFGAPIINRVVRCVS